MATVSEYQGQRIVGSASGFMSDVRMHAKAFEPKVINLFEMLKANRDKITIIKKKEV